MRYWIFLTALTLTFICLAENRDADGGDPPLAKAINLDKLNTEADEEDPCPTPDGNGLLHASKRKDSYDIYLSKRTAASMPFGPGKPFIADPVADERAPFMHQGKYYFVTNEIPDKKLADLKNYDVMMQVGFQKPGHVLGDINSKADEMYPWVGAAGKEFYYSRKTEAGWRMFVANGPVPGPIGKSKEVGFAANFHRATLAGGLTMFLQGPLDKDRTGIFRSRRDKIGAPWSKPEPVASLNHPESKRGDMQPALTADGTRLYFVSDRPGGKGGLDIWVVTTASLK